MNENPRPPVPPASQKPQPALGVFWWTGILGALQATRHKDLQLFPFAFAFLISAGIAVWWYSQSRQRARRPELLQWLGYFLLGWATCSIYFGMKGLSYMGSGGANKLALEITAMFIASVVVLSLLGFFCVFAKKLALDGQENEFRVMGQPKAFFTSICAGAGAFLGRVITDMRGIEGNTEDYWVGVAICGWIVGFVVGIILYSGAQFGSND